MSNCRNEREKESVTGGFMLKYAQCVVIIPGRYREARALAA